MICLHYLYSYYRQQGYKLEDLNSEEHSPRSRRYERFTELSGLLEKLRMEVAELGKLHALEKGESKASVQHRRSLPGAFWTQEPSSHEGSIWFLPAPKAESQSPAVLTHQRTEVRPLLPTRLEPSEHRTQEQSGTGSFQVLPAPRGNLVPQLPLGGRVGISEV
nr:zinc finger protein 878 isoform X2 [Rattus norvegicus]